MHAAQGSVAVPTPSAAPQAPHVVPLAAPPVDVPPLAVDEEEFEEQAARAVRARRVARIVRIVVFWRRPWELRKRS